MSVRANMQTLIDSVREKAHCATDDVYNGVTYWTDVQIQSVIDSVAENKIVSYTKLRTGSTRYVGSIHNNWWVDPDTIAVLDNSGTELGTGYTGGTITGVGTFNLENNTLVSSLTTVTYVDAMWFPITDVVAELWLRKAQHRSSYVAMGAGANKLSMQQEYEHCMYNYKIWASKRVRGFSR